MQTTDKNKTPKHSWDSPSGSLLPIALLALPLVAFAQTDTDSEDNIFTLSPFEVDGSKDQGYRAANTLSGTRLNAQLKDTSASVTSFTQALLDDLGATDLESVMAYSSSAEKSIGDTSSVNGGNDNVDSKPAFTFRIRGFEASRVRDFFTYELPVDVYNTERLDESRGPNSVLFGIGSPGGIINTSIKRAKTNRNFTNLQLQIADENGLRFSLDTNKVLVEDKLALRINAVSDKADGWRYNTEHDKRRVHGALTFQATENTTIRTELESGSEDDVVARPYLTTEDFSQWDGTLFNVTRLGAARNNLPNNTEGVRGTNWFTPPYLTFISNNGTLVDQMDRPETDNYFFPVSAFSGFGPWWNGATATSIVPDESLIPASVNLGGPGSKRNLDFDIFTLAAEHQIGDLFVELAYQRNKSDWVSHWTSGATVRIDPNNILINGSPNPYVGQHYVEGNWDRRTRNLDTETYRATVAYKLETEGAGQHDFMVLLQNETQGQRFTNETLGIQDAATNAPWGSTPDNLRYRPLFRQYVELGEWENFHVPSWENLIQGLTTVSDGRSGGTFNGRTVDLGWNIRDANQNDDSIAIDSFVFGSQNYWLDRKLVTTLGYRKDDFTQNSFRVNRAANGFFAIDRDQPTSKDFSVDNLQAGVVYHINKQFGVFYNMSDNTSFPNFLIKTLPEDLTRPIVSGTPNPGESEGWDTGVIFELFDNKFSGRLTYYEVDKFGDSTFNFGARITTNFENAILNGLRDGGFITPETRDERVIDSNGSLFDEHSEGYELTTTANITKNWRANFNASYTDRVRFDSFVDAENLLRTSREFALSLPGIVDENSTYNPANGETIAQFYQRWQTDINFVRRSEEVKRGLRKFKANLFTAYDFKEGRMKGFSVGGGIRYQSANIVGVDGAGNILEGEALDYVDLLLRYNIPGEFFGGKANVQLNVSNLFESDDIIPIRYTPVPDQDFSNPDYLDTATFKEPREIRLTLNLKM